MDKKLTDSEIVKALEDTLHRIKGAEYLIVPKEGIENLCNGLENALDLINRQKTENDKLKDILYDADGVNLVNYWHQQCKIAENGCRNFGEENKNLKAENERKDKVFIETLRRCALKDEIITEKTAEIERLKNSPTLPKSGFINLLCDALIYTETLEQYNKFRRTFKAEAYKEFAEKLYEELRIYGIKDKFNKSVFLNVVDKAKKELVGDSNES